MMAPWRGLSCLAGFAGASGIVMAALGGHLPSISADPNAARSWQAAVLIHLVHACALVALAALARSTGRGLVGLCGFVMFIGALLFSGTIYVGILTGTDRFGPLAPVGGVGLMLAWLLLIVAVVRKDP